jgi:hypothetical protein
MFCVCSVNAFSWQPESLEFRWPSRGNVTLVYGCTPYVGSSNFVELMALL